MTDQKRLRLIRKLRYDNAPAVMVLDREDHRKGSIEPVCYQFENVFVRCWIGVVFGEVLMYYDRHKKIIWYSSMHRDQPLPDSYREPS